MLLNLLLLVLFKAFPIQRKLQFSFCNRGVSSRCQDVGGHKEPLCVSSYLPLS